ncbi:MAG: VWA domain-containing protein [Eubacteriales bacterium]|nr:VWA domain-containing protein [Eubacteriales bacterium]
MKRLRTYWARIGGRLLLITWICMAIIGSVSTLRAEAANNPPVIGTDHPENPGDVMLFKQVKPVDGMVNTWDVSLRIEAMDKTETVDVVLVIDRSGSMKENGRMPAAIRAANAFVDTLLPGDGNTRIAVVSYATDVTTNCDFTKVQTDLNAAIDNLRADGGTFTQGGIKSARDLLAGSTANQKHIVLLSDGLPTFSYKVMNLTNIAEWEDVPGYGNRRVNPISTPITAYDYTSMVGNGRELLERYPWSFRNYYYHSGNSAIAEAGFAKGTTAVWTIGLETDATGNEILRKVATSSGHAFTANPADLQTVFTKIAGSIKSAAQNVAVTDPMGQGFVIPIGEVGNISVEGTTVQPIYDATNKTLAWHPGTLTTPIAQGSNIKYAQLNYRIEIDDDILNAAEGANGYSTNGNATVTYTDIAGHTQTSAFPVPEVRPYIVILEKVLQDHAGNVIQDPDRKFTFKVTRDDGAYEKDYELAANQQRVLTNLRLESTYTIEETTTTTTPATALSDYETSYELDERIVEDQAQRKFKVEEKDVKAFLQNGHTPKFTVSVTNKEKPLAEVTVKKVFNHNPGGSTAPEVVGTTDRIFTFKQLQTDPETTPIGTAFFLKNGETKTFTDLPYANYTIWEEDYSTEFDTTYTDDVGNGDGYLPLTIYQKSGMITVTNVPKDPIRTLTINKKWLGGTNAKRPTVTFEIMANGTKLTEVKLTKDNATDENIWTKTIDLFRYDTKGNVVTYTVQEKPVDGYQSSQPGTVPTVDTDGDMTYEVTNTKVVKLTVKKTVSGNLGNKQKDFTFKVVKNGQVEPTFTLKDGETKEFSLIKDDQIQVIEEGALKANYVVSATLDGTAHPVTQDATQDTATCDTLTIGTADQTLTIDNNRQDAGPATGIWRDQKPQLMLTLTGAAVLAAGLIKTGKKKPQPAGGEDRVR